MFNHSNQDPEDSDFKDEAKKLYPKLKPKQREESLTNLYRYFEIVNGIFEDKLRRGLFEKSPKEEAEEVLRDQWEKRFDMRVAKHGKPKSNVHEKRRDDSLKTLPGSN